MSVFAAFQSIQVKDTGVESYKVHELVRRPYSVETYIIVTRGQVKTVRTEFWLDGKADPLHVIETGLLQSDSAIPEQHARLVVQKLVELRIQVAN